MAPQPRPNTITLTLTIALALALALTSLGTAHAAPPSNPSLPSRILSFLLQTPVRQSDNLPGSGLTLDLCLTSADCQGNRRCVTENGRPCPAGGTVVCICVPPLPNRCSGSDDCTSGEVCSNIEDSDNSICVSEFIEENVDGISEVCVDARALGGLGSDELVYETHRVGRVLCDKEGSCATGGHVVVFQGNAMMMRTYCAMVGCVRKRMLVNSPRYVRARRVASKTEGLEYTAFAARWETAAEERVLTTAVRLGL